MSRTDEELRRDAELVTEQVRSICRLLRRGQEAEIAASGLTAPQVAALDVLAEADGLTLKELSARLGLAHSTASGIVDRLERRGLAQRQPDPADRRASRIVPAPAVREYLQRHLPQRAALPVIRALAGATPAERRQVREGLAVLRRLLEAEKK